MLSCPPFQLLHGKQLLQHLHSPAAFSRCKPGEELEDCMSPHSLLAHCFGYFLLFTAVAIGITAFPVLCRILTELKLLDTTVGVVVLAAGIGNDVAGWILLALTVALVNASTGLTALYVLLAAVGYVLFLIYPGRWAYVWLARRTGSLEQGSPTTAMMTVTLFLVFVSAFFTDIIGIHPIFGKSVPLPHLLISKHFVRWIPGGSDHSSRKWIRDIICRKTRRSRRDSFAPYRMWGSQFLFFANHHL